MSSTVSSDDPVREDVLERCRDRVAGGNEFVRAAYFEDLDYPQTRIGNALAQLESEGLLNRFHEGSDYTIWRATDELLQEAGRDA